MRRADDIPSAIVNLRLAVAEKYGANKDQIIEELGLDRVALADPQGRITVEDTMRVWEGIIRQTGYEYIGLECGTRARFQTMGTLGYVMMNSPSVAAAYEKMCTYQRLVMSVLQLTMLYDKDTVTLEGEMIVPWRDDFRYTMDFMFAGHCTVIKNFTSEEIRPIEVGLNYPTPPDLRRYHEIFGNVPITFNLEKPYLKYRKEDMELPILGVDSSLFEHFELKLEQIAEEHNQVNKATRSVKQFILDRLKAEIPRIEDASKEMAMSVRSLQQALKDEGTSFQKLLNEVRKEVSTKRLRDKQLNITEVAFLTGFSDISVFSRSFKKWTGLTPTQFQMQLS